MSSGLFKKKYLKKILKTYLTFSMYVGFVVRIEAFFSKRINKNFRWIYKKQEKRVRRRTAVVKKK